MAASGSFREDLLYRLDVVAIAVPPLRERRADLPMLVADLIDGLAARLGIERPPIARELLERLERHRWPGNVRELANVLEAALICGGGDRLELPEGLGPGPGPAPASGSFDDACRAAISAALSACGGKIYGPGAAERLELKPATLQSKMRKLGIDRAPFTRSTLT
jgi:DNA-binding NtrC family response regulator